MGKSQPSSIFDFYQSFSEDQMAFAYLGPICDDITELIIEVNIEYLPPQKTITLKRRFSFLLAESFQNLIRHGNKNAKIGEADIFFLSTQRNNTYFINSINKISKEEEIDIKEKLDSINSVEPEKLRQLYLTLLDKNTINAHGGAGLGFIEMVRKSGQKLNYKFESLSLTESLFIFQLWLKEDKTTIIQQDKNLALNLYKKMKEQDLIFAFKGRFIDSCTPVSLQAVIKILQTLKIQQQSTEHLTEKVNHFMLIHNDLQKKYQKHIHFLITLKAESNNQYVFTICCQIEPNYRNEYTESDLKILNSNDFTLSISENNNALWTSLSSKIE
jgi:hypothetical protein